MKKINVNDLINAQINAEFSSWYLYLSMATNARHKGFHGFEKWFREQSRYEMAQAEKFIEYFNGIGEKVSLFPIENAPIEWESPLEMFKYMLYYETKITRLLEVMEETAEETKDSSAKCFISNFINEQSDTKEMAKAMIAKLEAAENDEEAIMAIDAEAGKRK